MTVPVLQVFAGEEGGPGGFPNLLNPKATGGGPNGPTFKFE